jgi:hypothetical protein
VLTSIPKPMACSCCVAVKCDACGMLARDDADYAIPTVEDWEKKLLADFGHWHIEKRYFADAKDATTERRRLAEQYRRADERRVIAMYEALRKKQLEVAA